LWPPQGIEPWAHTSDRPTKHPGSAEGEKILSDLFEEIFKTNPKKNPQFFWNIFPFSAADPNHNSIKPLTNIPLRVYTDFDINWYIENRHVDFTDLNITDGAPRLAEGLLTSLSFRPSRTAKGSKKDIE